MPVTKILFLVDIVVSLVAIACVIVYFVARGNKQKADKSAEAK